ncbi:uncharacterized protein FIBRA_06311 [Fibroporia radiculosa]|uniref:TPR-like protein n=1 Tax=Fibroporia radiculosa TaxID=599839 RepID=J4H404_9APHY|nr:uncharacterized protein FIBRA_06311 [Fibroporia radiculosa]CCM04149.1 predicted protein [Fibroporia radiculosa]
MSDTVKDWHAPSDGTHSTDEEELDVEGESEEWTGDSQSESSESGEEDKDEGETGNERKRSVILEPPASVETQIEGDFDRLVENIRKAGDGSSTGILTKVWDINIEDQEAEFRDDLREASGVGRAKRKKRGRRPGPVLSQQVRALIGEGNQAYVDNNLPEAIRVMEEVIRIEPRAASAWSVLAQCYADLAESQKTLLLRVMAAHLNHDAEEWDQLARQSRELGYNQQALYCYRKAFNLDPTNVNALWDRASLAKEIGDLKTARSTLVAMLKRVPHNLTVLDELRPVLIELSDLTLCATLFSEAFAHNHSIFPSGIGYNPESQQEVPGGGFGLMHLLVLADLYNTLGKYEKAIDTIRKGCRWLQGRAQQVFWDVCEDDREYDAEGFRCADDELQPGIYPLDVNARHRLAVARIKMGDAEEGKIHAKIVLSQDAAEYAPLFGEIADAYFDRELYVEAGHIYEILGGDAGTSSLYVLMQAAACRRMIGDIKEAAEVYQHVIAADATHNEAKMKLAEIYEILNEPRKALELVLQVMDSRKRRPRQGIVTGSMEDPSSSSLFEEKSRSKAGLKSADKLSATQLRELESQKEREVSQGFHIIRELWPRMLVGEEDAEREWLIEAEKLVESFRETRALFVTSRHKGFRGMFPRSLRKQAEEANEESMASRLQLDLRRESATRKMKSEINPGGVDVFRTIPFDEWLRLFLHYAFLLTKRGQYDSAHEILRHITYSSAYQTRVAQDTIRLALITCAIQGEQFSVVVEQSRKLVLAYQFNNEPLRVLLMSLSNGHRATDAFLVSTLAKHLLRELKLADTALKNPEALRWNSVLRRYGLGSSGSKGADDDDTDDEEDALKEGTPTGETSDGREKTKLPTKGNPVSIAIYGQICLAARSYQSALSIASFGRAMQRQADNRNHLITQASVGLAFLSQYRSIRGENTDGVEEVEYNFGRAFQQLGLHSLAARHYERVLELAEKRAATDSQDGLAREAAYNLSIIFVTTGAGPLAEKLYRRWLSL